MAMEKGAMGLNLFWPVYIKPAGEYLYQHMSALVHCICS